MQRYAIGLDSTVDALRKIDFERGRTEGLRDASGWCKQQANALKRLGKDDEKRKAFVEAHNAILSMLDAALRSGEKGTP